MLKVLVDKADATLVQEETLTSGRVGIEIEFEFSEDWDDLGVEAIFVSGTDKYVEVLTPLARTATCTIPHEVLDTARQYLTVGVYGVKTEGTPAVTTIVIPTVWCGLGLIEAGADPTDADNSATPTASDKQQMLDAATEATTAANDALKKVIRQAEATIDATSGTPSVTVALNPINPSTLTEGQKVSFAFGGLKGVKGDTGNTGATGPAGADGSDGEDGEDGFSPIITTSAISGGTKITITDATHTETVDVMNGTGAGDMLSSVYDPELGAKQVAFKADLADVAYSGSYSDLSNKPTIPTKTSDLTNDGDGTNPFLTTHQSLVAYRTSADQDIIDNSKITNPAQKSDGQVLTYNGSAWVAQNPSGAVQSVNTKTGVVVLDGGDINVDDSAATPTTIASELTSHSASIVTLNTTVATKADKSVSFTLTLDADDWDSTEKTLTVTDERFVTSGFDYIVTPTSASFSAYASAQICAYDVTVASSMTFHAETVPTDDLTVNVMKVMVV